MEIKYYSSLHSDAMYIRTTVFVDEQGFVDNGDENDSIATHIVMYDGEKPVSVCRVFAGEDPNEFYLGRMAVVKEYRYKGIGGVMMTAAENLVCEMKGKRLLLHSQLHAKEFYEKCGYSILGEVEYEQGEPHVWMQKIL